MDLLQRLIEEGFLDNEKADFVLKEAENKNITKEEILLKENIINEEDLFTQKSYCFDVPFKKEADINIGDIPESARNFIHFDSINHYKMVVIGKNEDVIEIGMIYPENIKAREALNFILKKENLPYKIYLITPSTFTKIAQLLEENTDDIESPLLKKLVERGLLKKEDVVLIIKEAQDNNSTPEELIIGKNLIEETSLLEIKSEIFRTPIRDNIDIGNIPLDVLGIIHEDSARHYKMVPIGKTEDKIEVGMVYPENTKTQEALKFISRQDIFTYNGYLISLNTFNKIIDRYKDVKKDFQSIFLEKLLEKGLIDRRQLLVVEERSKEENKKKEEILLEENIVTEKELFQTKADLLEIPFKNEIDVEKLEEYIAKIIPKDIIDYYKIAPFRKENERVQVAMVYPEDSRAQEALRVTAEQGEFEYDVILASFSAFNYLVDKINSYTQKIESGLMERLIEEGFLDNKKVEEIERQKLTDKMTTEEVLLKENIIEEDNLFVIKSSVVDVPYRSMSSSENISEDILMLIPEDSANYYKMAPIGREGDKIEVGMVYPENLRAKEALKFLSRRDGISYEIYLISLSTFENISKQYRTIGKEVGAVLEDIGDIDIEEDAGEAVNMDQDVGRLAEEAPIVKVVAVVLRNAIEGGASDIHIEPMREKLKVRFRVDGTLYASLYLPINIHLAIIARVKILAGLKIDEQRLPQDGRFSTRMRGKSIDFRVSTLPTTLGEKVVVRVLDSEKGLKDISELGIIGRNFEILDHSVKRPTGMTLVTGPTGSGKTTTLYALLKILNKENVNIVTLEDPVEYFMDGINQSQVHSDIGYVFATGLRQILRQDPDIIMVGEIRDEETADLAVHAALTGHMVLSTLHTNNAIGVIPRLIDMGIKPFLIPAALNTAMSQRLVGRICDKCKKQITPSKEIEAIIREELNGIPKKTLEKINIPEPLTIYVAEGCKYCSEEGVGGRIAICEILNMTASLGEIIMGDLNERKLREEAINQGMTSIKQDGMLKVIQGYTTIEEVLRATEER